jgi:alpha-ketoglutarate-dependent taurine dioxygenase
MQFKEIEAQGQKYYEGSVFPLMLELSQPHNLADVLKQTQTQSHALQQRLQSHGAILFRGLPIVSDTDFDKFITAFNLPNFTYSESLSNAVRKNRTERVFTANEAPPDVSIFLHHEMAQTPIYPSKLFFFCELAASSGGATPLCRSDILLQQLIEQQPEFVALCESKGVRYTNTMPCADDAESGQGRSWRSTLSAETPADAEARLSQLNYQWRWLQDQSLTVTSPVLPAIKVLANGKKVFFNQLIAAFRGWKDRHNAMNKTIMFGDGTEIPASAMAVAISLADELSFDVPWRSGDVALVDNYLVMHGRRPFQGQRRVLASLVAA